MFLRIDVVYTFNVIFDLVNVSYTLHKIKFEWDERKSKTNLRKHKVSFRIACEVFFDPFLRVVDAGVIEGESREAVIGMTENWRLLYVVFVERDEVIRLLSARPVEKEERQIYENQ
ncbi:MAG TPA: BrnT family toxin [Pyrinomonadaceae bacterium]|nr:BrnT family toxin [Pyrinomonadaceae bacterium]